MHQLCINYTEQSHVYFYPKVEDPADDRSQKTLQQRKKYSVQHFWLCLPQLFVYLCIKVNQND